jgi:hypothetical protein
MGQGDPRQRPQTGEAWVEKDSMNPMTKNSKLSAPAASPTNQSEIALPSTPEETGLEQAKMNFNLGFNAALECAALKVERLMERSPKFDRELIANGIRELESGAAPSSVTPREDILKWLDAYGIAQDFDTNDGIALIQAWESARASSPSSATEQERWISVDEKLPAANWYGMFVTNENFIELGCFRDDPDEKPCWVCERTAPQDETIKYVNQDGQVTYWRELPKPPSSAGTPEGK